MKYYIAFVLLLWILGAQLDARSAAAIRAFKKSSGYPQGRVGYVVDHKIPLCFGGADTPANMQWQEKVESKVKDADEIRMCAALRRFEKRWLAPPK